MSKNVALMRKANPHVAHQKGNGQRRIVRLDPDRATPVKNVEPVEKIFWSRVGESRRVIAFAGVDSSDRMSARVAEILARPRLGTACLVDAYLHSPSLCDGLGLGNPCRSTNALQLGGSILDFTIPVREGNLSLLPWGSFAAESANYRDLATVKGWLDELGSRSGDKLHAARYGAAGRCEFTHVAER
jgi:hypothetical protein